MKNLFNLFDEADWKETENYPEGTKQKVLSEQNGIKIILLKLPKDFKMNAHSHMMVEQHFVVKGVYTSEGVTYSAGSYRLIDAHENHGPFESKEGALILVIWDPSQGTDNNS